jgi:transposase, IS5 family
MGNHEQDYGCYPERICANCIYINTKNRNFCIRNDIGLSCKRLGRPQKNPEISAAHKQQLSADQRRQTKWKDALDQERESIHYI